MNIDEGDWSNVGKEWIVSMVDSLDERDNPKLMPFFDLPKDKLYSLHLEYKLKDAKPFRKDGLDYEQLRREIAGNLAIPSNSLMQMFVAPYNDDSMIKNSFSLQPAFLISDGDGIIHSEHRQNYSYYGGAD